MITIANINDINPADYVEVYICMRSIESLTKDITGHKNVFHLPELSPSTELFLWSQKMKKKFRWTETLFKEQYVPWFLKEMQSQEARNLLLSMICRSKDGIKIAICCSCPRQSLCHRSILAGLLHCNGGIEGTEVVDIYGEPLVKYDHYYGQYQFIEASLAAKSL